MPHTQQQRLLRCGSTDGQYKSYGLLNNWHEQFFFLMTSSRLRTPLPLVIKRHQAATSSPPMMTSSRNVKFYIPNHLKALYNRLLVLMHSAETAFRNRHGALNIFPDSARPLLDAAYEWHNIIRCGWLMFVLIIVVEMNFVDIQPLGCLLI